MHAPPFWLPVWQAASALLAVATDAATVFPVMLLICLLLSRGRQREAMAQAGHLFLQAGFVTAAFGALAILGQGFVNLVFLPASMSALEPLPFAPLSGPWLSTSSSFAAWTGGICFLLLCRGLARPVYRTAFADMDEETEAGMVRRSRFAACAAFAGFACFFAALVLRNWPFLGLPHQMTEGTVAQILLQHAWRESCIALMPAGAIAVLSFFLRLPPLPAELRAKDRENRRGATIPGTAEEILPFTESQATALRMCAAFGLAGAAFQLLDAGFLAFNAAASLGGGPHAALLRFGPLFVTATCLVCWAFIFSKPARRQIFLALFPVLLILLRAVAAF